MSHSCIENFVHVVFATKDRRPFIVSNIESHLYSYIVGIARNRNTRILTINGTVDHVHILLRLHPDVALATLLKEIKSYSSAWMKKNGQEAFAWQEGYGGFSYSISMLDRVIEYIADQKQHHRNRSFQEEMELLKRQWNVQWDI